MVRRPGWVLLLGGVLAIGLALAAACGPAASSDPDADDATGGQNATSGGGASNGTPQPSASQGGSGGQTKATASVTGIPLDPNARYGGVLRTSTTTEGPTFNNWEETIGISPRVNHMLLNQIVRYRTWGTEDDFNAAAFLEQKPDLATSWEQSSDGLQWMFHLRDDVTWSDGVPFTCADVQWSLDSIRTGDGLLRSPRALHFSAIDTIQCPDDRTMVVTMKWAKSGLLEAVGGPGIVIRAKHAYENDTAAMRERPADPTTGPYKLVEWIPGEKYRFERNPDYWDQPLPYLDGVELLILASQAEVTALRAGRLDVGATTGYQGAPADNLLSQCSACQFWPRLVGYSMDPDVIMNQTRAPWNDQAVRDAVSLAIDRKKYIQIGQQGWGELPMGGAFYPLGPWGLPYERLKQIPGYDFDASPEENKEKARQLLASAGYLPGDIKVSLVVISGTSAQKYGPPLIEDLNAVGIQADLADMETARFYNAMSTADFSMTAGGFWVESQDPDWVMYEFFYTGSDRNYGRYSNLELDRLIDQMSQTVDPELRKQRAWDAMEIGLTDQAHIVLSFAVFQPAINQRVRGYMPAFSTLAARGPINRFDHVWLAE